MDIEKKILGLLKKEREGLKKEKLHNRELEEERRQKEIEEERRQKEIEEKRKRREIKKDKKEQTREEAIRLDDGSLDEITRNLSKLEKKIKKPESPIKRAFYELDIYRRRKKIEKKLKKI